MYEYKFHKSGSIDERAFRKRSACPPPPIITCGLYQCNSSKYKRENTQGPFPCVVPTRKATETNIIVYKKNFNTNDYSNNE